jgi:hypothetical protein
LASNSISSRPVRRRRRSGLLVFERRSSRAEGRGVACCRNPVWVRTGWPAAGRSGSSGWHGMVAPRRGGGVSREVVDRVCRL